MQRKKFGAVERSHLEEVRVTVRRAQRDEQGDYLKAPIPCEIKTA